MRWSEKDERKLLDSINGDVKPTNTWKFLFWGLIGTILWVTILLIKL